MIRTISQAVKYLELFIPTPDKKHPGSIGLYRMKTLVKLFSNPQLSYPTIHVGGTSGKGSTATIIAAILGTKYLVGLHTSPHLERINERIQIYSRRPLEISDSEFAELINQIKPAIEKMGKNKIGFPSYFEIITALAFLFFAQKKTDLAVIEVGMGGIFDATNIINPEIAVVTNVGLDHTEVLGETVEKIAKDKAGIIKPGIPVITGAFQPSVIGLINEKCRRQKAELSILNRDFRYKINKITDHGSYFDYWGKNIFQNLFIPLLGEHQVKNSALAIRAVEEWPGITEKEIKAGLEMVSIAARMEVISKKPLVILDGAHNPDKMQALTTAVKSIWPTKRVISVIAIKEEKNAAEILRLLIEISGNIILTEYEIMMDQGIIKSYNPSDLKKELEKLNYSGEIDIQPSLKKAVKKAIRKVRQEDLVLITGSLYLTGLVRSFFKRQK